VPEFTEDGIAIDENGKEIFNFKREDKLYRM